MGCVCRSSETHVEAHCAPATCVPISSIGPSHGPILHAALPVRHAVCIPCVSHREGCPCTPTAAAPPIPWGHSHHPLPAAAANPARQRETRGGLRAQRVPIHLPLTRCRWPVYSVCPARCTAPAWRDSSDPPGGLHRGLTRFGCCSYVSLCGVARINVWRYM